MYGTTVRKRKVERLACGEEKNRKREGNKVERGSRDRKREGGAHGGFPRKWVTGAAATCLLVRKELLAQSEVCQDDVSLAVEEDVLQLDVAVDYPQLQTQRRATQRSIYKGVPQAEAIYSHDNKGNSNNQKECTNS